MKKFRLFGQYLDKPWILKSSVCPCSLEIGRVLTEFGFGLDSNWTDSVIGQRTDRDWTKCGRRLDFGSMSNQLSLTCTETSMSHLDIHHKQPQKTINVCGCLWLFVVVCCEFAQVISDFHYKVCGFA